MHKPFIGKAFMHKTRTSRTFVTEAFVHTLRRRAASRRAQARRSTPRSARLTVLAGLTGLAGLAVASLASAVPAQAETWCLRDSPGGRPVCVFPSARQCVAGTGAFGGICERQSAVERAAAAQRDSRKSMRKFPRKSIGKSARKPG